MAIDLEKFAQQKAADEKQQAQEAYDIGKDYIERTLATVAPERPSCAYLYNYRFSPSTIETADPSFNPGSNAQRLPCDMQEAQNIVYGLATNSLTATTWVRNEQTYAKSKLWEARKAWRTAGSPKSDGRLRFEVSDYNHAREYYYNATKAGFEIQAGAMAGYIDESEYQQMEAGGETIVRAMEQGRFPVSGSYLRSRYLSQIKGAHIVENNFKAAPHGQVQNLEELRVRRIEARLAGFEIAQAGADREYLEEMVRNDLRKTRMEMHELAVQNAANNIQAQAALERKAVLAAAKELGIE